MRAITKKNSGGYQLEKAYENSQLTSDEASTRWKSFKHKAQVSISVEKYPPNSVE
jgi:hypothetical protein